MLANASDVSKCKVNFFPIINVQILKKNEEKQEKTSLPSPSKKKRNPPHNGAGLNLFKKNLLYRKIQDL